MSPRRETLAVWLAAAALLLGRAAHLYNPYLVVDDAFISFRYAANLANGHGLVFNPGEKVEGYTNFLWTLLLAGGAKLGLDLPPLSIVLALLAALGTLYLLHRLARTCLPDQPLLAALPPPLYAAMGSQPRLALSGMETLLFVFLLLAGLSVLFLGGGRRGWGDAGLAWRGRSGARRSAVRDLLASAPGVSPAQQSAGSIPKGRSSEAPEGEIRHLPTLAAGVLFALASMTRPEGLMYFALTLAFLLLLPGPRRRRAAAFAGAFLLLFVPYFLWRWNYYGYPLPNTFYVKASHFTWERIARGWEFLLKLESAWHALPFLAVALASLPSLRRRPLFLLAWSWVAASLAYFLYTGGDFLVFFGPRFLLPALPFLLILAADGIGNLTTFLPRRRALQAAAGLALLAHAVWLTWPARFDRLQGLATEMEAWTHLARWIAEKTPEGTIATGGAGIVPYYTGRFTIDMYGLADEHIAHMPPLKRGYRTVAHEKYDPHYVLDRRPDLLITGINRQGRPRTAGLGRAADRVDACYRLKLLNKVRRGRPADGKWVIEPRRFRPEHFDAGYWNAVFERRLGRRGIARCEAATARARLR